MAYQTWIADKLREYGLEVIEVSGWQTRGSSTFNPQGVVAHHTASHQGKDAPALGIVTNGRSDLPGPLSQILLARSGKVYVVAAGRANHAGSGGYRGLSGNTNVFGIEAENDGVGEPWPAHQLEAYYKVCAALLEGIHRDSSWTCGHKEWAPRRKIDPANLDMNVFRSSVSGAKKDEASKPVEPAPQPEYKPESGVLSIWEHGPRTKDWQKKLVEHAGQDIEADGFFGPSTHDATVNFQTFFKLTVDGIAGEKTIGLMDYIIAEKSKPKPAKQGSLRRGSTGDAVKEIQKIIGVSQDGIFGSVTERAVKEYQKSLGVPQTGVWDETTRNKHSVYAGLPAYSAQPLIQQGHQGASVKIWQEALNKYAGAGLKVDSDFGKETYLATFNFQKFFSMRADGIVGSKTWGMMDYIAKSSAR